MSPKASLGPLLHSFFADHLITVKGLRPSSVRSYRDTIRLLILFLAADNRSKITKLTVGDLTFERVIRFLRHLEQDRGNHTRTRKPTTRRDPHPVRVRRLALAGDAERLPAGRRDPDQTRPATRDPLPRTRRDHTAAP
jgi:Phage integrase, N-terminal SAM-like domain